MFFGAEQMLGMRPAASKERKRWALFRCSSPSPALSPTSGHCRMSGSALSGDEDRGSKTPLPLRYTSPSPAARPPHLRGSTGSDSGVGRRSSSGSDNPAVAAPHFPDPASPLLNDPFDFPTSPLAKSPPQ